MLTKIALVFGVIFVLIGILGFIPSLTPGGMLLGYFHVNTAHNIVHLLTGIVFLYCSYAGETESSTFFKIFGVVYALVAVLGFMGGDKDIFGLIANNAYDNYLHTAIALVSLYFGFLFHGVRRLNE